MFEVVETDKEVGWKTGDGHINQVYPVLTLADDYGGRAQVIIDDHCFVLLLKSGFSYQAVRWIFKEAFEAMKTLDASLLGNG